MPKPKVSEEDKLNALLLDALRKAIDGTPQRLQGTAPALGLFPGGAAGAKLVNLAYKEALLQEVPTPEPQAKAKGRTKPAVYVQLTDKGRQYIFERDSPARLVEGLRDRLEAQGASLASSVQEAQSQLSACRDLIDQCEQTLRTHFARHQQTAEAFRAALDRLALQPAPPPVPPPTAPATWLDAVVPFVADQKRLNSFDRPNLKKLYEHLRQTTPDLTIGQFHDGLRALHQQRRIRLDPYTQALATLLDPIHALYLDREVKYYVDLP